MPVARDNPIFARNRPMPTVNRRGQGDSGLELPGSWLRMVPRRTVLWAGAVLAAAVTTCVVLWGWLSDDESTSATIRNLGLFAVVPVSFWLAMWRNTIAQSQAATARGSLLNERYEAGATMLAGSTPLVRIAGVHALRQIAQESPHTHRRQAIGLLAAFVRHPPDDEDSHLPASSAGDDVKSAIEAIHACRSDAQGPAIELDLRGANLQQLKLYGVSLRSADLTRARLRGARFEDVDLSGVELVEADLRGVQLGGPGSHIPCVLGEANLSDANLTRAVLAGIDLCNSDLTGATLQSTNLGGADLRNADFTAADLTEASLAFANLSGANLAGAILTNTDLTGARLFADDPESQDAVPVRGLKQTQLDAAHADREWPPKLGEAVIDAGSGFPLVWRPPPR